MPRTLRLAAAQVGAIHLTTPTPDILTRLLTLLTTAALTHHAQIILFPELTFTTFFPRHLLTSTSTPSLDTFFSRGDITTDPSTCALFDRAKELGVDICVGFAEETDTGERFNSCVYFHARSGSVLAKYRKVHLPGDVEPFEEAGAVNQLEKRYFKPGDLGFRAFRVPGTGTGVGGGNSNNDGGDGDAVDEEGRGDPILGMMICNDRRWAEAWRCLGLQGVEIVLTGYNTPGFAPQMWGTSKEQDPDEARADAKFHHKLVMQAFSYSNSCFSVSAARCGLDDGKYDLVGGSMIIAPDGKIIAESVTEEDEVVVADCNLDQCLPGKKRTFDFGRHRRIEHYSIITSQTGVVEPPKLSSGKPLVGDATKSTEAAAMPSVSGTAYAKPIRILLCNPNASSFMTKACLEMVQPTLPPDVSVHGFTAPKPAPSAIEGNFDNIMSSAAAARAIIPIADQYDAFLVACYSDHALIKMLREELLQPVVGIMEASLFTARTLGSRFGIIATSQRSKYTLEDSVRNYGLEGFCAGVRSCNLGALELESKPEEEVLDIMCEVGKKLVVDGADVLTLGCAGMTNMKAAVEKAVGNDVQVIDGVVAGVHHLAGLCRMGTRTAKSGMYMSSAKGRESRGQDWI